MAWKFRKNESDLDAVTLKCLRSDPDNQRQYFHSESIQYRCLTLAKSTPGNLSFCSSSAIAESIRLKWIEKSEAHVENFLSLFTKQQMN